MKLFAFIDDAINTTVDTLTTLVNEALDKADGFDNLPPVDIDGMCKRSREQLMEKWNSALDEHFTNRDPLGCPLNRK